MIFFCIRVLSRYLKNIFAVSSKMEAAEDKTSKIATIVGEDCILDQSYAGKRIFLSNWLDFTNLLSAWNTNSIFLKVIIWLTTFRCIFFTKSKFENLRFFFCVSLHVDFSGNFWDFSGLKFTKSKYEIMAVFETPKWPRLISRKIWVAEKS